MMRKNNKARMKRAKPTLKQLGEFEQLSDVEIHLRCGEKVVILRSSKLHLAVNSEYFKNYFFLHGNEKQVTIHFDEEIMMKHFVDLHNHIFKEELRTPVQEWLSLLDIVNRFKLDNISKRFLKMLKERATLNDIFKFLSLPETMKSNPTARDVSKWANEYVVSKYRHIMKVNTDEFNELPFEAVLTLISSNKIIVDSENTVLTLVFLWICSDWEERNKYMEQLLPHIRFPQMKQFFLIYIVPHVAETFPEPIKTKIHEFIRIGTDTLLGAKQITLLQNPSMKELFESRITMKNSNKFTLKHTFKNISNFNLSSRPYSKTESHHGYDFCFFLGSQQNPNIAENNNNIHPQNLSNYVLSIFVQCSCKLLPKKKTFYLPLRSTFRVITRGSPDYLEFPSTQAIFDKAAAFGGAVFSSPNENLSHVISGESLMVINDTITIMVDLEFLDQDEGCRLAIDLH